MKNTRKKINSKKMLFGLHAGWLLAFLAIPAIMQGGSIDNNFNLLEVKEYSGTIFPEFSTANTIYSQGTDFINIHCSGTDDLNASLSFDIDHSIPDLDGLALSVSALLPRGSVITLTINEYTRTLLVGSNYNQEIDLLIYERHFNDSSTRVTISAFNDDGTSNKTGIIGATIVLGKVQANPILVREGIYLFTHASASLGEWDTVEHYITLPINSTIQLFEYPEHEPVNDARVEHDTLHLDNLVDGRQYKLLLTSTTPP